MQCFYQKTLLWELSAPHCKLRDLNKFWSILRFYYLGNGAISRSKQKPQKRCLQTCKSLRLWNMEKLMILRSELIKKKLKELTVYRWCIQITAVHHHKRNWSSNRNWSIKSNDSIEGPAIPDTQLITTPKLLNIPQTHSSSTQYQQLEAETYAQKCSNLNVS